MRENIIVPALGESITEATVSKWIKIQGDQVREDEPIVELETDKVNVEVPSPAEGVISKINFKAGDTVEVGALLGTISSQGDKVISSENVVSITKPKEQKKKQDAIKKEKDIKPDEKLKHFGYDFFTLRDSIPIWDNLPMPPSYRLGPGDEIIISLWGETQLRSSYTIGRGGMIYIERVGKISLADKSINQAKTYLEKQFQKVYETLKGSYGNPYIYGCRLSSARLIF